MILRNCLNSISNSLSFFLQVGQEETLCKIDTDTYGGWYTAPVEDTFNGWGPPRAIDRFNDKDVVPISIDTSLRKACFQHHYLVSDSLSYLGAKVPKVETKKSWFHYIAQAVLLLACIFLAPLLITPKAHAVGNTTACVNNVVGDTGSSSNTIEAKTGDLQNKNLTRQLQRVKRDTQRLQKGTALARLGLFNPNTQVHNNPENPMPGVEVSSASMQLVEFETGHQIKVKKTVAKILHQSNLPLLRVNFVEGLMSHIIYDPKKNNYPQIIDPIPSQPESLQLEIKRWVALKQSYQMPERSLSLSFKATLPFERRGLYGISELSWDFDQKRLKFKVGVGSDSHIFTRDLAQNVSGSNPQLLLGLNVQQRSVEVPFLYESIEQNNTNLEESN